MTPRRGGAVWVTRPAPDNLRTADAVARAGYRVLAVPLIEIRTVPPATAPAAPPDLVVLVSANAVRGLAAALADPRFPRVEPASVRAAAVGARTAALAAEAGWRVEIVPGAGTGDALAKALAAAGVDGLSVWIPAGNREGSATRDLPGRLAAAGARPEVFQVYETLDRRPAPGELARLAAETPGAVVVHSPSIAGALFGAAEPEIRRWREEAALVAIGPATGERLHALGAGRVVRCARPADEAIAAALDALDIVPTERNPR